MILRYQGDDLQEFVVYVLADQKVLRLFTTYTHALYSSIRTLTTATTPSTTTYTHVLYSSIRTLTTATTPSITTYTHVLYSSIRTLTTATTLSTTTYTHVLYSSIRTLTTTNIKSNVVLKVSDFRIDLFRTICHPFCRSF